jgi:hypothetical protein
VIEINEGIGSPQLRLQFFTGDDLTGTFHQQSQYLKRLSRKLQTDPVLAELSRLNVDLKRSEAVEPGVLGGLRHRLRKNTTYTIAWM